MEGWFGLKPLGMDQSWQDIFNGVVICQKACLENSHWMVVGSGGQRPKKNDNVLEG